MRPFLSCPGLLVLDVEVVSTVHHLGPFVGVIDLWVNLVCLPASEVLEVLKLGVELSSVEIVGNFDTVVENWCAVKIRHKVAYVSHLAS